MSTFNGTESAQDVLNRRIQFRNHASEDCVFNFRMYSSFSASSLSASLVAQARPDPLIRQPYCPDRGRWKPDKKGLA
jgi:hypothetical protein